MEKNLAARVSAVIEASKSEVWQALVDPDAIEQYMFGADVETDWDEGSPIFWRGEWEGEAYEDKGEILKVEPESVLQYTHFSPLSGLPDEPENYHTVTIELSGGREQTRVLLTQDNNADEDERKHSEENWEMMLEGLREVVEG
jgi:uncharacterized protein YndB with AHSA1/START domain